MFLVAQPFFRTASSVPLSFTYNGAYNATAGLTVSIPGVSYGVDAPGRIVVICVGSVGSGNRTVALGAIGGIEATVENSTNGNNVNSHMLWTSGASGTSGVVDLAFTSAPARQVRITSYSVYGATLPAITGTSDGGGNASRTSTVVTVAPSVIIACATSDNNIGTGAWSGTSGVTSDFVFNTSPDGFSSASNLNATAGSKTSTRAQVRTIMSAAFS